MEISQALELLVARAKERTGIGKDSHLARELGLAQDNYISMWRAQIRRGGQGPAFVNIVSLLEAAGVFATESDEAERLHARAVALEEMEREQAEVARRALAEPRRRVRRGRGAAQG